MDADECKFNGPKYLNVKGKGFLITFIYSKASLAFLCFIGALTAANIYLFLNQISNASLLCEFNDYLPMGKDVRQISMPIVYYCRFLEFSIPTNIFQLLFCLAALFFALNRRSSLFIFAFLRGRFLAGTEEATKCYSFLCLTLLISGIFFAGLLILNYQEYVIPAIETLLWGLLQDAKQFCRVLEPRLNCRMINGYEYDAIEQTCGMQRSNVSQFDCLDYLSSSLMSKNWLIGLIIEYTLVIFTGIFVTVRAIKRRFCFDGESISMGASENRCNGMNGFVHETQQLVQ